MLPENIAPHAETLTQRQREVVYLLASGSTMMQAGKVLGIKKRTIAYHNYRVMTRLHLHRNTDLIRFAIKEGIVTC